MGRKRKVGSTVSSNTLIWHHPPPSYESIASRSWVSTLMRNVRVLLTVPLGLRDRRKGEMHGVGMITIVVGIPEYHVCNVYFTTTESAEKIFTSVTKTRHWRSHQVLSNLGGETKCC